MRQAVPMTSPAFQSGSVDLLKGLTVDQDGNPRTFDGRVDMGAVETIYWLASRRHM